MTAFNRRQILGLGLGAAAAVTLAACGDDDAGPAASGNGGKDYTGPKVQLNLWTGFTGGDGDIFKKLLDQFNAEHNNIALTMSTYKWEDYYAKLPGAVSSGNGPDVAVMHMDMLATFAARKVIQPVDDVASALGLSESDFAATVWKGGIYQGKRYGVPLDMHPVGMYYNKTLFQRAGLDPAKPPTNRAEFEAALAALKKAGIQGFWISPFQFTGGMTAYSLVHQFGGALYNADATKAVFNSDQAVEAVSWLTKVVADGHSPANVGQDADILALKSNQNAININGIWQINDLKKSADLQWGVAPVPQIGTKKAVWANSHNFTIVQQKKNDANKVAGAKVFINWLSQHSLEWAAGGQVPARNAVRDDPKFKDLAEVNTLAAELPDAAFPPAAPGIGDVTNLFYTAFNEAVLGKKSPKQALDDGVAKADKLLEENRKKYGS
jgi:multiple sugar transport system substrate-binding protein